MFVIIPDLLSSQQLEAIAAVLDQSSFIDGKLSAGAHAANHKNNLELSPDPDTFDALNSVVMTRLVQHPLYLQAAIPARIAPPIYARYTRGMGYGRHLDDPIMGAAGARFRTDISITVFLNAPTDYEGGELCIDSATGPRQIKLPAGQAVLYPSSSIHSVAEVSAGERRVAITWVQSHIRDASQRDLLMHLAQATEQLAAQGPAPLHEQVNNCYANLFRMWAEF